MALTSDVVVVNLRKQGYTYRASEGRLLLAELLLKAGAGYYNSHTEEAYMRSFGMLRADRKPNKKGAKFLCDLFYRHSNLRAPAFDLMRLHRNKP